MFSCALVSFIKMDGAQRPGNTSSLLLFAQLSPSIYLCPSICLLLALCPFCFLSLRFYHLQNLCLSVHFCHLTSQAWELERFVILYLSYSCLICQQMCSIWDFPFLCLCGPLGCQSQLRGHYWQLRRQGLSVGQSKVYFFVSELRVRLALEMELALSMRTLMLISKSCLTCDYLHKLFQYFF